MQEVVDLAHPQKGDLVLDVATGTGNTAFALAPHARRVIGLDLTREMLLEAGKVATEKNILNVDWVIGDAEHLPFQDETFDVYTVRAAPHHFLDVDAFMAEAFRVLKPGRDAAFVDEASDMAHGDTEPCRDCGDVYELNGSVVVGVVRDCRSGHGCRLGELSVAFT